MTNMVQRRPSFACKASRTTSIFFFAMDGPCTDFDWRFSSLASRTFRQIGAADHALALAAGVTQQKALLVGDTVENLSCNDHTKDNGRQPCRQSRGFLLWTGSPAIRIAGPWKTLETAFSSFCHHHLFQSVPPHFLVNAASAVRLIFW